jgi:hypothetical protein
MIECSKISTSFALGIRLVSFTVMKQGNVMFEATKSETLELSERELEEAIEWFIPNGMLETVKGKVERIRKTYLEMLEVCPRMRWYSGSIFIAYDGDDLSLEPRVVLIDFAHFHWDITADGGNGEDAEFDDGNVRGFDSFLGMIGNCITRAKVGHLPASLAAIVDESESNDYSELEGLEGSIVDGRGPTDADKEEE